MDAHPEGRARPFPVLGRQVPASRYVPVDLTPGSGLLAGWEAGDITDLDRRIRARLHEANGTFGWGGYLEERRLYAVSGHFGSGEEARTLHLGIDLWAPAGTPVYAPWDAMIHSLAMNGAYLDYGATIILHHPGCGDADFSLYGHLRAADLDRWRPGDQVGAGECLAHIGPPEENGGWVPHLHLQLIRDIGSWRGDFPGVARPSEKAAWMKLCPDPASLAIPEKDASPLGTLMSICRLLLVMWMLGGLAGCSSADLELQAREICACLRPLDSLNAILPEILAQGDTEEGIDRLVALGQAAGEARECLGRGDLPEAEGWREDAVLKALLDRDCPRWESLVSALPPE